MALAFLVALGVGGVRAATGAPSVPDLIAFLLYRVSLVPTVMRVSVG